MLGWGFVVPAAGWGDDGHRVVGRLAWLDLTPEVRERVRELLPDPEYSTLAETTTWADTYARRFDRYDWLKPYHYMNADPGADRIEFRRDCADEPCVIGGIRRWSDALADNGSTDEEKVFALRMLAHLVGDIHQPLHVSHPDGTGGNATSPRFFGEPRSLHAVWDTEIIKRRLRDFSRGADSGASSWERLASHLHDSITPADREKWRADLDTVRWADESLVVARNHVFGVEHGEPLGRDYYRETVVVVERRLRMAGVRLAALLSALLSNGDAALE